MRIKYPVRSKFLEACEDAISKNMMDLFSGKVVSIGLSGRGYSGKVQVDIVKNDDTQFDSDWEGTDPTRFPARIRTAAHALYKNQCFGKYKITHKDGILEITKAAREKDPLLIKKIMRSQQTDGVRINKSFHNVFNPPDSRFYVARGESRDISVLFNKRLFKASYLHENPKGVDREMQSIRFSKELQDEFIKIAPNLEGYFSIKLGNDLNEFIFQYLAGDPQEKTVSISFENLKIGESYNRPHLAELWGYEGYQAISKGVITPRGSKYIILFVTKEKQEALPQYNDYIDGDLLFWEGEEKHGSDKRIINAAKRENEIHLFYREIHHSPFVYYGKIHLLEKQVNKDQASEFIFAIGGIKHHPNVFDDIDGHKFEFETLKKTEQESVVKSRIGQGIFRENLIKLWGACSVTGVKNLSILKASHIKPWRDSTNEERLDPYNGLLLTPNLDELFDAGFISFNSDGSIQVSDRLEKSDRILLGIKDDLELRRVFSEIEKYLEFHRKNVFLKYI